MIVQFKQWICSLIIGQYGDGSKALELINATTGEPIATCTVSLAGTNRHPAKNNVFVKGYSENEGMEQALIDAGVIKPERIRTEQNGFVEIGEYTLTDEALALFD